MDINRVAYFFGVNKPPRLSPLRGAQKDARRMSERFSDRANSPAYEVHLGIDEPQSGVEQPLSAEKLRAGVDALFNPKRSLEVALFYFAGHGLMGGPAANPHGFYLMTSDATRPEEGVAMSYILAAANSCDRIQEKIIILDCCHAGHMGNLEGTTENITWLKEGVSILAATHAEEAAVENVHGGLFTRFFLEALGGGAADPLGRVTLASIYSYIDLRLSLLQQRPVFKANITRMMSLYSCTPYVTRVELLAGLAAFPTAAAVFPLDHSYDPAIPAAEREEPVDEAHARIFRIFQRMRARSLLEPVEGDHLYWAAHRKEGCRLTSLGRLYWESAQIRRL